MGLPSTPTSTTKKGQAMLYFDVAPNANGDVWALGPCALGLSNPWNPRGRWSAMFVSANARRTHLHKLHVATTYAKDVFITSSGEL